MHQLNLSVCLFLLLYRDMEWTGNYITDFSKLLPQLRTDGFSYDEVCFWLL
jgi:diphthamide biosynthesis protein 2